MSIPAINWCIEQNDLSPAEWVVLFHLAHCHNHETGRCDPSQDYLADMTNMGSRTVRRHLKRLEQTGRIARKKRGVEGGGRVSDYYILGHEPAKMAEYLSGHLMRTNRPSHAENVHEMAAKQEVNRKEQEVPPVIPQAEPPPKKRKASPKSRLPEGWVVGDEGREYASQRMGLRDDEIQEIENDFREYWTEGDGAGKSRTERGWAQAWRNRCGDVAQRYKRNRQMAGGTQPSGYGQGGGIASAAARRHAGG